MKNGKYALYRRKKKNYRTKSYQEFTLFYRSIPHKRKTTVVKQDKISCSSYLALYSRGLIYHGTIHE